jgi:hypothetical protein
MTRPVRGNEYDAFWPAALAYLDIPHDPASKNAARFWYLPSCPPDAEPIFESHDGKPVDVDMVMAIARASAALAARAASKRPFRSRCPELGSQDPSTERVPATRYEISPG